jgi:IS4 transposase
MLFSQLSGQKGLRGLEYGINSQKYFHNQLEICKPVKRSTIAYANQNRSSKLFEEVYFSLLRRTESFLPKHKHKFKNPLFSIDATTIDLCLKLFPWAKFRRGKAGVKVSVTLDHKGYIPRFVVMYNAREHEITKVNTEHFNKGDVVAFDRGFNSYSLFNKLSLGEIFFVTRQKTNSKYRTKKRNKVDKSRGILLDEIILFTGAKAHTDCPVPLRRIVSKDKITGKQIVILTNHLAWAATTIAQIYRDRWQIELFFKAMKQNLKIKSFLGTSENAVLIQLWTAMIAYLLYSYIKYKSKLNICFKNFMLVLPTVLFQCRDLWEWLFGRVSDPLEVFRKASQLTLGI